MSWGQTPEEKLSVLGPPQVLLHTGHPNPREQRGKTEAELPT